MKTDHILKIKITLEDGSENKIEFINKYDNPLRYPPIEYERATEEQTYLWFKSNIEIARERIRECKRHLHKKLDLGNCGLTDSSSELELLEQCTHLKGINLGEYYYFMVKPSLKFSF